MCQHLNDKNVLNEGFINSGGWLAFTLSSNLSCQGKLTAESELSDCLIFTYNKKHYLNKLIKGDVEIDTVSVTFYQKEDL